jgi:hypothetical protein
MDGFDRDLFGHVAEAESSALAIYPDAAWFKGEAETGREAAEAIAPKLGYLQNLVRDAIASRGPNGLTPEEAVDECGKDRVSLQPRFSELKAKGVIVDSGLRRRNGSSGKRAVVWVLPEFGPKQDEGNVAP